jgi:hypothetical protein
MITQTISRVELLCPHTQDKRTIMLNKILNNIVGAKDYQRHDVYCEFRCYAPNHEYYFIIKTLHQYNNPDILCENVHLLIEQVLDWYDLSDVQNFDVKFDEGGRIHKCTYFDLAWWGYHRRLMSHGYNTPFYSDEKRKKIFEWGKRKMESEKKEYDEKMMRALGGGRAFCDNRDPIIIHKPEGFIMRIKNKLVNLCHELV